MQESHSIIQFFEAAEFKRCLAIHFLIIHWGIMNAQAECFKQDAFIMLNFYHSVKASIRVALRRIYSKVHPSKFYLRLC